MKPPLASDFGDWSHLEPLMYFVTESGLPPEAKEVADDGRDAELLKEASRRNRRLRLSRKRG